MAVIAAEQEFRESAHQFGLSGQNSSAARCLRVVGYLATLRGNYRQARSLVEEAVSISGRENDVEELTVGLAFLSEIYSTLGFVRKSSEYADRSQALMTRVTDSKVRGDIFLHLGQARYALEDIEGIWHNTDRGLAEFQQSGDNYGIARALVDVAYARFARIELPEALSAAEESIVLSRSNHDVRTEARALIAKGLVHVKLGEPQDAIDALRSAERVFPADLDRSEYAVLQYNFGRVHQYLGNCSESLPRFEQALRILDAENNSTLLAGSVWSAGEESLRCGDVVKAVSYLQRSKTLASLTKKKHSLIQSTLGLGRALALSGESARAIKEFEVVEQHLRSTNSGWSRVQLLRDKARVYMKEGFRERATLTLSEALRTSRQIKDTFLEAELLELIALNALEQNEIGDALAAAHRSVYLTDSVSVKLLNFKFGAQHLEDNFRRYELKVKLLMRLQSSLSDAFLANEKIRSRNLQREILRSNLTGSSKSLRGQSERLENARLAILNHKVDELTSLLANGASEDERIRVLENEIRLGEQEIEEIRAGQRRVQGHPIDASELPTTDLRRLQASLETNDAILEFATFDDESYLWVVKKNAIEAFVLPPRREIESRISQLRNALVSREVREGEAVDAYKSRMAVAQDLHQRLAKDLSNELFGPLAQRLHGMRLIVVSDGPLQYFPIGALPWPGSESDEPILVTNEVVYAPSASVLQLIRSQERKEEAGKDLLVFADPVFSKDDTRLTGLDVEPGRIDSFLGLLRSGRSVDQLARLQESEAEAKAITRTVGGFATDVRLGFAANRENVLNANLGDYKMLHFATHGRIEESRPELSGIVLSLYDEAGKQNDGGFIRLQDVYGMNLKSDLVVLSACDTGIGKEVRGEGLLSLTNAFLQAGSKTVVSSLWKVDDAATKELMTEFYRGMAEDGLTVSAALRQAQLKLYRDPRYSSPFYWAAFTMHGDYDRVPQISARYSRYAWVGGILIAVFLGFYLFRVSRELRKQAS